MSTSPPSASTPRSGTTGRGEPVRAAGHQHSRHARRAGVAGAGRHLAGAAPRDGRPRRSPRANTDRSKPYRGYYFKILKGQGPHAQLGEMDFVVQGR